MAEDKYLENKVLNLIGSRNGHHKKIPEELRKNNYMSKVVGSEYCDCNDCSSHCDCADCSSYCDCLS